MTRTNSMRWREERVCFTLCDAAGADSCEYSHLFLGSTGMTYGSRSIHSLKGVFFKHLLVLYFLALPASLSALRDMSSLPAIAGRTTMLV